MLCYAGVCFRFSGIHGIFLSFSANVFRTESIHRYVPSIIQFAASMSNSNASGPIEQAITEALQMKLEPIHLEVVNESYMHNVPKGAETHFKVLVVSEKFESLPLIKVRTSFRPQHFWLFEFVDRIFTITLNLFCRGIDWSTKLLSKN